MSCLCAPRERLHPHLYRWEEERQICPSSREGCRRRSWRLQYTISGDGYPIENFENELVDEHKSGRRYSNNGDDDDNTGVLETVPSKLRAAFTACQMDVYDVERHGRFIYRSHEYVLVLQGLDNPDSALYRIKCGSGRCNEVLSGLQSGFC